jgi:tRNA(His) 5'-end guanylyltransferase
MTSKDEHGDRMKALESAETGRRFDPTLPIYARIDGRGFSKFTKGMDRPFDARMLDSMIGTTKYLVEQTHAAIGYVQSDEISLVWDGNADPRSEHFFGGKIQKICSVLASMTAARFAVDYFINFGELSMKCPHFDCRVIQMPDQIEAANMLLWREIDARKNSVSMLARHYFSHHDLHKKSSKDMLSMLADKGILMYDQMTNFQRGTWVRRVVEDRSLTEEERAAIPFKYQPPSGMLTRSKVQAMVFPPFSEVSNRVDVIFAQAEPRI